MNESLAGRARQVCAQRPAHGRDVAASGNIRKTMLFSVTWIIRKSLSDRKRRCWLFTRTTRSGISRATDIYSRLSGQKPDPRRNAAGSFSKIVTHPVIKKFKPKIVIGRSGASAVERADRLDEFKIDYLIDGEVERVFNDLFMGASVAGDPSARANHQGAKVARQETVEEIPVVRPSFNLRRHLRSSARVAAWLSVLRAGNEGRTLVSVGTHSRERENECQRRRRQCAACFRGHVSLRAVAKLSKPMCRRWKDSSKASSASPALR